MEPNENLIERMMTSISSSGDNFCLESSTELDSHANMVVIGKQAFIFSHSGQYANVRAFTDEVKGIPKVPIVDAVIAYDFPTIWTDIPTRGEECSLSSIHGA